MAGLSNFTSGAQDRPTLQHKHSLSEASAAEDLFSSITGLDDYAGDDDLCFDDETGEMNGRGRKGKRLGANTAEKKATHNAVERARRETLNGRFLILADMLPGMNNVKRASKAAIVNKSIELITELQHTEVRLTKETEALKAELEALRQQTAQRLGMPGMAGGAPLPMGMMGMGMHMPPHPHMFQPGMPPQMGMPMMQMMPYPMPLPQHQTSPPASVDNRPASAGSTGSGSPFAQQQLFPAGMNSLLFKNDDSLRHASNSPSHVDAMLPLPPVAGMGYPFDVTGMVAPGMNGRKDSLSASAAGSGSGSGGSAPSPSSSTSSPPSSHSVPTPANTYSPIPLPSLGDTSSSGAAASPPTSASNNNARPNGAPFANPAFAAFDMSHDPAFLAASFAPQDLAKARSELESFIQFQQQQARLAAASLATTNNATSQQQQQQQQHSNVGMFGFPGNMMMPQMPSQKAKEESPSSPFGNLQMMMPMGGGQANTGFDMQSFLAAAAVQQQHAGSAQSNVAQNWPMMFAAGAQ